LAGVLVMSAAARGWLGYLAAGSAAPRRPPVAAMETR